MTKKQKHNQNQNQNQNHNHNHMLKGPAAQRKVGFTVDGTVPAALSVSSGWSS